MKNVNYVKIWIIAQNVKKICNILSLFYNIFRIFFNNFCYEKCPIGYFEKDGNCLKCDL